MYVAGVGAEAPGAGWHHGVSPERNPAMSAAVGTARTGVALALLPRPRQLACLPDTRVAATEARTPKPRGVAAPVTVELGKPIAPTKRLLELHTKDTQPAKTVGNERQVSLSLQVSNCCCVDPNQTVVMVTANNAARRALTPLFP